MTFSQKQRFNQYEYMPTINPKFVQYQRIIGSLSGNRMSFHGLRPLPNQLLSSKAYIKWTVQGLHVQDDGAGVITETIFPAERIDTALYQKPFMVMANATRQADVRLNGYSIQYNGPTDWMKYIGKITTTESQLMKYFSTCGSPFPVGIGAYDDQFLTFDIEDNSAPVGDDNISIGLNAAYHNFQPATGADNTASFTYLEPLQYGPFNPFYDLKDSLPDSSWFKHMSDTIPYVQDIQVSIALESIMANNFVFAYSLGVAAETTQLLDVVGSATAELVLQWVCPREAQGIPPVVQLPSWQVDARKFDIGVVDEGDPVQVIVPIQNYHTVPDYFLIFATHDKTAPEYICKARVTDDDNSGGNQVSANGQNGSQETNLAFENLLVTLDVNNSIVDSLWSDRELYNVTAKNCVDIPETFSTWVGGDAAYAHTPSQAFVLFKPDDLNVKWSSGQLRHNFNFQLTASLRAKTGSYFMERTFVENATYAMHVVLIYKNYFIDVHKNGQVTSRLLNYFV